MVEAQNSNSGVPESNLYHFYLINNSLPLPHTRLTRTITNLLHSKIVGRFICDLKVAAGASFDQEKRPLLCVGISKEAAIIESLTTDNLILYAACSWNLCKFIYCRWLLIVL